MRSLHVAALHGQSDELAAVGREIRIMVMASPACRRTAVLLAAKALLSAIYDERVAIDDEVQELLE
jgi:hypothetical protein